MIIVIVIAVIIAAIVIWAIAGYNGLVRGRNSVEESFSTMDVYLKKRYDLIPNLVEMVKGYASHESETLDRVTRARSMIQSAGDAGQKLEGENQLTGALRSLFAVSEGYPELKANQNFLDLQEQLKSLEDDIANARKYYNAVVKNYNNRCEMFPGSILAGMFHFEREPMFEVSNVEERQNVKVDFHEK